MKDRLCTEYKKYLERYLYEEAREDVWFWRFLMDKTQKHPPENVVKSLNSLLCKSVIVLISNMNLPELTFYCAYVTTRVIILYIISLTSQCNIRKSCPCA
jgi:hypothetical protein